MASFDNPLLYLNIDKAGVDAMLKTKKDAILSFSTLHDVPLSKMAAIGDGTQDLEFMLTPGLGLVGAPANAQKLVKEKVGKLKNGFVSDKSVLDAFFEFYDLARERGISHVISDRDGVLVWKGDYARGTEFYERVGMLMGLGFNPLVAVLTGSGIDQNRDFMKRYGLSNRLGNNAAVERQPTLLLAENGIVHMNVLTGRADIHMDNIDPYLFGKLKGDFQDEVLAGVERDVLPRFGFTWSKQYNDQKGKVYVPVKVGALTLNVPREDTDGSNFRGTKKSTEYSEMVMQVMKNAATLHGMPYTRLDKEVHK